MLVLGIAMLAALLIPLVTLGSYKRLINTEIHWGWLLAAGLAIQLGARVLHAAPAVLAHASASACSSRRTC